MVEISKRFNKDKLNEYIFRIERTNSFWNKFIEESKILMKSIDSKEFLVSQKHFIENIKKNIENSVKNDEFDQTFKHTLKIHFNQILDDLQDKYEEKREKFGFRVNYTTGNINNTIKHIIQIDRNELQIIDLEDLIRCLDLNTNITTRILKHELKKFLKKDISTVVDSQKKNCKISDLEKIINKEYYGIYVKDLVEFLETYNITSRYLINCLEEIFKKNNWYLYYNKKNF